METKEQIEQTIGQFTGTERWYRHALNPSVLFTDGARYLAEAADAFWLLDIIVSYQGKPEVSKEPFQVWRFKRGGDSNTATPEHPHQVTMTDGNDGPPIVTQDVLYTDFPLDEAILWVEADEAHRVILLPSEH